MVWETRDGRRQFFPRLGAPVAHLALPADAADGGAGGALVAVASATNAVKVVSLATRRVVHRVAGVRPGPAASAVALAAADELGAAFRTFAAPHAPSGTLAFADLSGGLQFYDAAADREAAALQAVPQGHFLSDFALVAAADGAPGGAYRPDVRLFAVAPGGRHLATLDEFGFHANLRFWAAADAGIDGAAGPRYVEQAVVRRPHAGGRVTALAWHPGGEPLLATVAQDGLLKLWSATDEAAPPKKKLKKPKRRRAWDCLLAADLADAAGDALTAVAWSPCGSVLAVAGRGLVALWDLQRSEELARLRPPAGAAAEKSFHFTRVFFSQAGDVLVAVVTGAAGAVVAWDLRSRRPLAALALRGLRAAVLERRSGLLCLAVPRLALQPAAASGTAAAAAPAQASPLGGTCILTLPVPGAAGAPLAPRQCLWVPEDVADLVPSPSPAAAAEAAGAAEAEAACLANVVLCTPERKLLSVPRAAAG